MRRRTPGFLVDALSRPENNFYAVSIETAKDWGLTPMDVLIPKHQREHFHDLDYDAIAASNLALMQAWTMLKKESCPKCGTPYWIGHNTDRYIQFDVEEDVCHACAADERHSKNKKDKDEFGVITFPVLNMLFEQPRPTREAGYRAMGASNG